MKKMLFAALLWGAVATVAAGIALAEQSVPDKASPMRPVHLCCEYLSAPLGIDSPAPRLSWELSADGGKLFDARQQAYRIRVARTAADLTNDNVQPVWDSGWVESSATTQIPYAGEPLASDRDYFWKVDIKDESGRVSTSRIPGMWTSGLFSADEWSARWIGDGSVCTFENNGVNNPADPFFRKSFELTEAPKRAILFLASFGYHELYVNGSRVGDDVLAPNVVDYSHRAHYVAYDIKSFLQKGNNTVAVWLGAGWSVFSLYQRDDRPCAPLFRAQSDISLSDGSVFRLETDSSWKTAPSANRLLGKWVWGDFGGEHFDANLDTPNWNRRVFDDSAWKQAVVSKPDVAISAQLGEPNRPQKRISAVAIEETEPGVWRADMGQNFAGWTEIRVKGEPGGTIEFQFSESPKTPMTFSNHSRYTLDKTGEGTFKNRFNYSSGRWITVYGLKEKPSLDDFTGWTVRTDFARAAAFECSDDLQNWIYQTVLTTYENLALGGYIVDCPQRERMGYGGDAHATCETGMFNYSLGAFYYSWMQNWRDVQGFRPAWIDDGPQPVEGKKDAALAGLLPNTAPTYFGGGGPAWGGIVITLPWSMYLQYGDERVLSENFELIEKWLGFLDAFVKDGLLYRYGDKWSFLGDWLWPGAPDGPNSDTADTLCLNNIYRIFNLMTAEKIARVIGRTDRADEWKKLADEGRAAVHAEYFHPEDNAYFDGRMSIQSAALLADIPPQELRDGVMKRLEDEILVNQRGHIGAGITGGALLFRLLRQEGRDDLIWSMLSQTEYPGYGFMRANGATTLWEAWELDRPGHSLLHSSYLYPGAWYIDSVLGIRPNADAPGFRAIVIHPPKFAATPLTWAKGYYDAPTGRIAVDWKKLDNGQFQLKVELPPNTRSEVCVPSAGKDSVAAPSRAVWLRDEPGYSVFELPSGSYEFRSKP